MATSLYVDIAKLLGRTKSSTGPHAARGMDIAVLQSAF